MRIPLLAACVLLALALAACGSSSSGSGTSTTKATAHGDRWTAADILRLSGIRRASDGLSFQLRAHPECVTTIMLRSTAEVQSYKVAGDVVVTNPDGTA